MNTISIGHGRVDITPPAGTRMAGYAARTEPCRGIHDRLYANVVALSDGEGVVLAAAMDLASFDLPEVRTVKEAVEAATGVPPDRTLLNTSHTHAGPIVARRPAPDFEEGYFRTVVSKVSGAVEAAADDLRPAALRVGSAALDIGCNRRERTSDGRIILGVNPDGPRLAEVTVWQFVREGGGDVVLFSTPIHGTTMGADNLLISAEWMGAAVGEIERARPGARAVFLQGCAGNQNPYRLERSFEQVARHGHAACEAVCRALDAARPVASLPLRNVARQVQLPHADGTTGPCPLHGLRVGAAVLVGLGGEAFVEYAIFGRGRCGDESTMVLGYTDGSVGYLPTESAFAEGGYETGAHKYFPSGKAWSPGLEGVLRDEIDTALAELLAEAQ